MIPDQFKLEGRIALVTGASRGLGQAMAVGLAEAGADIACVSQSGDDEATPCAGRKSWTGFPGPWGQPHELAELCI
jgi:2-deoxy-D-gluconate 3-dehydrogenase